jgi:hypothetical protein
VHQLFFRPCSVGSSNGDVLAFDSALGHNRAFAPFTRPSAPPGAKSHASTIPDRSADRQTPLQALDALLEPSESPVHLTQIAQEVTLSMRNGSDDSR